MKKISLLTSAMTIALAGCGGGSTEAYPPENQAPETYTPKAGDLSRITQSIDNQDVEIETYKQYTLLESGQLVSAPVAGDENLPHIPILQSRELKPMSVAFVSASSITPKVDAASPNPEAMATFAEQLISTLHGYYNDASSYDAAVQVGDLDDTVENIYADYQASGMFSLADYVSFYEAIDKYGFDYTTAEAGIRQFLITNQITLSEFLQTLAVAGITWPDLLSRMKAKQYTFTMLGDAYAKFSSTLDVFLGGFVKGTLAVSAGMAKITGGFCNSGFKICLGHH
jgi:hypothetical protein